MGWTSILLLALALVLAAAAIQSGGNARAASEINGAVALGVLTVVFFVAGAVTAFLALTA